MRALQSTWILLAAIHLSVSTAPCSIATLKRSSMYQGRHKSGLCAQLWRKTSKWPFMAAASMACTEGEGHGIWPWHHLMASKSHFATSVFITCSRCSPMRESPLSAGKRRLKNSTALHLPASEALISTQSSSKSHEWCVMNHLQSRR